MVSRATAKASKASMSFCHFWSHLKGLYGGLHLPPPPFPPDHRQAGERGAMMLKLILLITAVARLTT